MVPTVICLWLLLALDVSANVIQSNSNAPSINFQREGTQNRTIRRLVGGHMKLKPKRDQRTNLIENVDDKEVWNDAMLLSSAGEGEQKRKDKEDNEDKKTLSDQVAEGKYGLIQDEIFKKPSTRLGVLSYENIPETQKTDNVHTLGGLSKNEIWLAEDQLLVLKGGSYPEKTSSDEKWPLIDSYEAPKRPVKLPQNPAIPPPFPVRLTEDGPLVYLTPNGSVPAPPFPAYLADDGSKTDGTYLISQDSNPSHPYPGDFVAGYPPYPAPPFSNAPITNISNPQQLNGSLSNLPPGATVVEPPPKNGSYDEEDLSLYYPPPYNFSYTVDHKSASEAGPLVPGIVLPPPPDFFAPLEVKRKPITAVEIKNLRQPYKQKTDLKTLQKPIRTGKINVPQENIVHIPTKQPTKVVQEIKETVPSDLHSHKHASKVAPFAIIYDYQEPKLPLSTERPIVFDYHSTTPSVVYENSYLTTTQVPLRQYYTKKPTFEIEKPKLKQVKPLDNSLTSFYFFEEATKPVAPAPDQVSGYYNTIDPTNTQHYREPHNKFIPSPLININFSPNENFFIWPPKQGPRTLTQEYFSVQNPNQIRTAQKPKSYFYQELSDINKAIDYYSVNKAKPYRKHVQKTKPYTPKPVYQYSFQTGRQPSTFHAPSPDTEPFRPMVSYSRPLRLEQVNITPATNAYHQYLIENPNINPEVSNPARSHLKQTNEDYDDNTHDYRPTEKQPLIEPSTKAPRKVAPSHPNVTPYPLHHTYFTKQEERYFDEITRNYFDIFGRKIENESNHPSSTPPTPSVKVEHNSNPIDETLNLIYDDGYKRKNHISLEGDTNVNYNNPPITEGPEVVEFIHSLEKDTEVNYKDPYLQIDPEAEFVPIPNPAYRNFYPQVESHRRPNYDEAKDLRVPNKASNNNPEAPINYNLPYSLVNSGNDFIGEGRPGTFVSYRLPGDGAHVYFVTPRRSKERVPR